MINILSLVVLLINIAYCHPDVEFAMGVFTRNQAKTILNIGEMSALDSNNHNLSTTPSSLGDFDDKVFDYKNKSKVGSASGNDSYSSLLKLGGGIYNKNKPSKSANHNLAALGYTEDMQPYYFINRSLSYLDDEIVVKPKFARSTIVDLSQLSRCGINIRVVEEQILEPDLINVFIQNIITRDDKRTNNSAKSVISNDALKGSFMATYVKPVMVKGHSRQNSAITPQNPNDSNSYIKYMDDPLDLTMSFDDKGSLNSSMLDNTFVNEKLEDKSKIHYKMFKVRYSNIEMGLIENFSKVEARISFSERCDDYADRIKCPASKEPDLVLCVTFYNERSEVGDVPTIKRKYKII